HVGLKLIAPPKFSPSAAARGILPLGFARKSTRLLRDLGEPLHKLLPISPAYICDRGIILARRCISTALCCNALVPLTDGDGKFADRKGINRNAVDRIFRRILVAPHSERTPWD